MSSNTSQGTAGATIGARLDRLPVSAFHRKVFGLVAVGMFFEGFDIYIAASEGRQSKMSLT